MRLPRDINADKLIKLLAQYGYVVTRQVGSHIRMTGKDGSHSITVPYHNPIKIGTLQAIIKDICIANDIDVTLFINKLSKL